jgi:hypothetical protein
MVGFAIDLAAWLFVSFVALVVAILIFAVVERPLRRLFRDIHPLLIIIPVAVVLVTAVAISTH